MSPPTPADAERIVGLYLGLYSSFETRTSPDNPVLLAHYTSIQVVEQILRNEEIWLSNPLYMNDLDEMRAGLLMGNQILPPLAQEAGGTAQRGQLLVQAFNHFLARLSTETALDTYVFCLSEHPPGNTDGRLPMWREYASKGNGAALVFNTQKVHYRPHSPLIIAKVAYGSYAAREAQLRQHLRQWIQITQAANLPDDHLYLVAYAIFDFIKSFSLVTKHSGFDEEKEWRIVYVPERDPLGYLKPCLDYFVGPRGVEPKLKYKFGETYQPEEGKTGEPLTTGTLSDILEFILLGPSASSPLAKAAFVRMLERNNKRAFSDRVFPSTIPLRPQP